MAARQRQQIANGFQRGHVGPMDVVDDVDDRPLIQLHLRHLFDDGAQFTLEGLALAQRAVVERRVAQQKTEQAVHAVVEGRGVEADERVEPLVDDRRGSRLANVAKRAHLALEHVVGAAGPIGHGDKLRPAAPQGVHVAIGGGQLVAPLLTHLGNEAGFAQPGLADEIADAALAGAQAGQDVAQAAHLAGAADQAGVDALQPAHAVGLRLQPQHAIGVDRLLLALDLDVAQVPHVEQRGDEAIGVFGDLHGAGGGRLLHARRQVNGVAHGRIFARLARPHLAHDDRAGVDAHAHVELPAVILFELMDERADAVDDAQPGQHGALRVIFVGQRRAEKSQHGVAHQPGDHAVVFLDGRDHEAEGLVHHLSPLFGVEARGQRRGTDDVAKQDGDDAALAGHVPRGDDRPAGIRHGTRPGAEIVAHRRRGTIKSSSSKHHIQSSPPSIDMATGWPVSLAWREACLLGELLQQPT